MTNSTHPLLTAANALRLLTLFDDANPQIGVTDLSRRLGLSKSVVSRIVATFVADGVLEQDELTRRCRLGPLLLELGLIAGELHPVRRAANPALARIREETGQNTLLWLLDNEEVLCLASHRGAQTLSTPTAAGTRVGLETAVAGMAVRTALASAGSQTPADPICAEEPNTPGVQTAACAVIDPAGHPVAALAVTAPVSWFGCSAAQSVRNLVGAAAWDASRRLAQ